MAHELDSLDRRIIPDLLRLVEEVRQTGEPRVLRWEDEDVVMLAPVRKARQARRARRTGIITEDDPILQIAGTGQSGIPGRISGRKYDAFREALGAKR